MYCIQTKVVKTIQLWIRTAVPSLSGTRDRFVEDDPSTDQGWEDGFGMTQGNDMYCALYFHYYCTSSTSGGQALDHRGWGPLLYRKLAAYRAALPGDEEEAGKPGQNTWRRARGAAGGEHHWAFVFCRLWGCRKSQRPRSRVPSGNGLTCRRTPTSLGFEFSESF